MNKILAGPILRRVDTKQVNIWLASSKPLLLNGRLYDQHLANPPLSAQSSFRTVKLGERLFVHLLKISPEPNGAAFPDGELLYYDILIQHADGSETSIVRQNPDVVFYESGHQELPGFFLPTDSQFKRILHGSCRRSHAKQALPGWERMDQLSSGAGLIEANFDDLDERPAALFLTGDQIYADDVAMPVLAMLIDQAESLTGWHEHMPVDHQGTEVTPADIKLHGRMKELKLAQFGITSTAGDNHLLTFAEYAGMYLAAFGANVTLPEKRTVFSRIDGSARGTYDLEYKRALAFFATRRDIRRLLANIPVYMIFDDHEVTDDWNLNSAWESKMYGNAFGKRMVSNALAAYWAFQGWGNDPDKFDDAFMDTIEAHLNQHQATGAEADAFDAQMLDRQAVDRWSYTLLTKPFTVVLDTRMHREFGSDGPAGACVLMDGPARDWLAQVLQQQRGHETADYPLLLVSASPVFGFARMERFQEIASKLGLSPAALDLESWREGFTLLESVLMNTGSGVQTVTILSGDVHYSFSARDQFKNANSASVIDVAQLTSSPVSNNPAGGIIGKGLLEVEDNEYPDLIRPQESKGRITSLNNIGLVFFADDGSTEKHVLVARKRKVEQPEHVLTYLYT